MRTTTAVMLSMARLCERARTASVAAGARARTCNVRTASALEMTSNKPSEAMSNEQPERGSGTRCTAGSAVMYCFSPLFPKAREMARTPHARGLRSYTFVDTVAPRISSRARSSGTDGVWSTVSAITAPASSAITARASPTFESQMALLNKTATAAVEPGPGALGARCTASLRTAAASASRKQRLMAAATCASLGPVARSARSSASGRLSASACATWKPPCPSNTPMTRGSPDCSCARP